MTLWPEREFEAVFRAVYPRVLRAAQLMLGERAAAEDVAQEALARLLSRGPLPAPDAERWTFRVARNLAVSRWRATRRLRPLVEAEAVEGWEQGDDTEQRALRLYRAVVMLPPRQRETMALRIYGELSYEAIARALGRSVGAVKQDLHRARLALQAQFNGSVREDDDDAW